MHYMRHDQPQMMKKLIYVSKQYYYKSLNPNRIQNKCEWTLILMSFHYQWNIITIVKCKIGWIGHLLMGIKLKVNQSIKNYLYYR